MAEADQKRAATVNVHEAKTHFSKLLDRAHAGEEIVVAKAGKPYAKLVPFHLPGEANKKRRMPGGLEHFGPLPNSFSDPLPDDELDAWEGKFSSF
ncbi:MAG TPA: type II toxin-antitoxin system Phd/YefM family antitoxin [Allosphingosinicella sp.]|nr:type II toxin-antitoxin system Phd/YefM family antitoxin [Allosphingosinicella sp.]